MTKLASLALAATTVALAPAASANTVAVDGGHGTVRYVEPRDPTPRRFEGRVGMLVGGSDVGDADGFAMGVSLGLGYRIGDVTLRGLFDHFRVGDGGDEAMERSGRSSRVGGALRYSFANTGDEDGANADFWGEIGFGYEHVAWRAGGVLDRPSGELAIGFELDAAGKERAPGRRRHIGWFVAFRTLLAQGPEMDGPAVCGGPCSKATKPSRLDASMFFELGLHWGR